MTALNAAALGVALGLLLAALAWWLVQLTEQRHEREVTLPAGDLAGSLPRGIQDVLSVLRSGGIVVDRSGRVRTATASAVTFGLVRDEHLLHQGLRDLVDQVHRDGQVREQDFEIARSSLGPGRILLNVRIAAIGDGLALVLVEDRTQARRVEEVRRDFVVNVSHELKTPVGGLTLLAEAVEGAAEDPDAVARFAGRMKSETQRLARLVSEIIDLSRLQTMDSMDDLELVDVPGCAREAVDHTGLVAGKRQILAVTTQPGAQLRIYGDHELITTAIRNLVTNAISYSEDGTRVNVVTQRTGDVVEVKVSDQGQGISPDDQERIFERFYRVDTARSRRTGGTGLGLSIVKHICANHGGEVTVWSKEGQGSTFTLRFPAATDSPPEERPSLPPGENHPTVKPRLATSRGTVATDQVGSKARPSQNGKVNR